MTSDRTSKNEIGPSSLVHERPSSPPGAINTTAPSVRRGWQCERLRPLIFQKHLLTELAPWLVNWGLVHWFPTTQPGCRGFTGPVPPPLWMSVRYSVEKLRNTTTPWRLCQDYVSGLCRLLDWERRPFFHLLRLTTGSGLCSGTKPPHNGFSSKSLS